MNEPKLRFPEFKSEWSHKKLECVAEIFDGTHQTPVYTDAGVGFVSVENILNIYETQKYISYEDYDKYKNKPKMNDIFMTRITAGIIGETAIVTKDVPLAYYVSLALIRCKKILPFYLEKYIHSFQFKKELHKRIIHTAFPKKINLGDIGKCVIAIPDGNEQQKIADFLSTIDTAIEKQKATVEAWEERKKGVMQKLFSQEVRFKADDGSEFPDWEEKKLCEVMEVKDIKQIPSENAPLMAFIAYQGVAEKGDRYDRSFLVKSNEKKYKRTDFNDFIYSSNNLDVGSIGLNKYGSAVISVVYEIFTFKENYIPDCMNLLIQQPRVMSEIIRYRQGCLYGQYKIHARDFLNVLVSVPCLAEQQKIAGCLSALDDVIEKQKATLAAWEEMKKGLLQQMFV